MVGRWADAQEKAEVGGGITDTNKIDIPPDAMPHPLDLVLKYDEDIECYGLDDDTPIHAPDDWRDKRRKLGRGLWAVKVSIAGTNVDETFWLSLINRGKAEKVRICHLDPQGISNESGPDIQRRFQILKQQYAGVSVSQQNTPNLQIAVEQLRERDPTLKDIIDEIGTCRLHRGASGFAALANAIINQRLSEPSSMAIRSRLHTLFREKEIGVETLAGVSDRALHEAGLSSRKIECLRDLAKHVSSGRVDFDQIEIMDDEAVIERLTQVKGIGRWTSEMYLIFSLRRLDVFPIDDIALRSSMSEVYGLGEKDFDSHALEIARKWKPFRSVASWYLYAYLSESSKRSGK